MAVSGKADGKVEMKFKPTEKAGGVVVELSPRETQLPPVAAGEVSSTLPVFKLKQILVPVDFSECSKKALQYAVAFAEQFDAELTLLHVVPANPPVSEIGPVEVVTVEEATREMEEVKATVGPALASQSVVRQGEPYAEIISTAKQLGSDLRHSFPGNADLLCLHPHK